jgi:hypothetical protein
LKSNPLWDLAGTRGRAISSSSSVIAATGTLTKNTARQPSDCASAPPMSGPRTIDAPPAAE